MVKYSGTTVDSGIAETSDADVINRLDFAIRSGEHWYPALLEAVGEWSASVEEHQGRIFNYIIAGEAFDWLLVAERLCEAVGGLIPEAERARFLFTGEPPLTLPTGHFRETVGEEKYLKYLNYFYGITVEEALLAAVEDEVCKEHWSWGVYQGRDSSNEAYRRIYGLTLTTLLRHFRAGQEYEQSNFITVSQLKEFTYWLFKLRLKNSDKAKVASDTKKGLDWLASKGYTQCPEQLYAASESYGNSIKQISQGLT